MSIQDLSDLTSFKWATVKGVNPLSIKLDGDTAPLALIPDSLVDPSTIVVGDRVRVELSLRKVVIHGVNKGSAGFGSGDIIQTAAASARPGWMLCQGQSLLRSDYPSLFSAIGTIYGAADSTHFSLPDLRGRVALGSGTATGAAGATAHALGQISGEETHALTVAEIPSHRHNVRAPSSANGANQIMVPSYAGTGTEDGASNTGQPTEAAGGGGAHNNMQPYVVLNYIIKL